MATRKQKEELIATLKFTPRTYKVELGAYGGEVYAGRVSREIYKYFKDNNMILNNTYLKEVKGYSINYDYQIKTSST